jgi:hypothetical protein
MCEYRNCPTAFNENSSVFWDVTPYSPLKVSRRIQGTCRLHLQKIELPIIAAVRTSNPTSLNEPAVAVMRTVSSLIVGHRRGLRRRRSFFPF